MHLGSSLTPGDNQTTLSCIRKGGGGGASAQLVGCLHGVDIKTWLLRFRKQVLMSRAKRLSDLVCQVYFPTFRSENSPAPFVIVLDRDVTVPLDAMRSTMFFFCLFFLPIVNVNKSR